MKKIIFLLIIFIIHASFSQTLEVLSPNGGENYAGGDKVYITWQASGGISRVRIECSLNNGGEWYRIDSDCSDASCRWVVPYIKLTTSQALIKITALDITNPPSDISDAPFTITAAPPDPYEPNNALNEAYNAAINDTLWDAMTMKSSSDPNSEDIDFFKFTLDEPSLIEIKALPDFIDTIDSGNIKIWFNDGTSKPILTLYDTSGVFIQEGYGEMSYNAPDEPRGKFCS